MKNITTPRQLSECEWSVGYPGIAEFMPLLPEPPRQPGRSRWVMLALALFTLLLMHLGVI